VLRCAPRLIYFSVSRANQRSTRSSQELLRLTGVPTFSGTAVRRGTFPEVSEGVPVPPRAHPGEHCSSNQGRRGAPWNSIASSGSTFGPDETHSSSRSGDLPAHGQPHGHVRNHRGMLPRTAGHEQQDGLRAGNDRQSRLIICNGLHPARPVVHLPSSRSTCSPPMESQRCRLWSRAVSFRRATISVSAPRRGDSNPCCQ
jgi:hypothetical protein